MKISDIGDGLQILIPVDYSPVHNWMGFISWYSISKNIPNCKVYIACNRKLMTYDLFGWAKKAKLSFVLHKDVPLEEQIQFAIDKFQINTPLIICPPENVCIRDFSEACLNFNFENKVYRLNEIPGMVNDCKDNISTVFVSYLNGWGKFVTSDWIHKDRCPLLSKFNFMENFQNVNEVRLGKIFEEGALLFNKLTKV